MKRILAYLLSFTFVLLSFTGCSGDSVLGKDSNDATITVSPSDKNELSDGLPSTEGDTVVLTIGDNETTYDEVLIYFRSYKQKIEELYGLDIWDYVLDEEGTTYAQMLKSKILEELIYIKTICAQAESLDTSLAEDERLDVSEYTADYMLNFTKDDLDYYSFTEETVKKIYEENMLANKIYELLTLNVDTDVDDEEVRHAVFLYIFISKTTFDEDGNKIDYTEEELEEIKLLAEEIHERTAEEDFLTLAKEYSDDGDGIEFTAKRSDMYADFVNEAFLLKEGEVSGLLENETGYFIFYCKNEKDEAVTEDAKIKLIVERQNNAFFESFEEWENNTKVKINEKIWEEIDFSGLMPAG